MPYLSLYRKYRSQVFDEIVGQEHITVTLKNAIERDRIAHAYLFSGPRGTGKTSTARILAKCINCEEGPTVTPCNKCSVCLSIIGDKLFDVIEIDAASNRGIDDVRDLKEKVRVPPAQARKKVYIIDEVHMLTREAFNALLKTLEEPPAHALFIMATTEPQKLPATILSRCQRFDFRRLTDSEIAGHIRNIARTENFGVEEGALDMIVKSADGSLRDAISVLDQLVSFSSGTVTLEDVNLMFGLVNRTEITDFMAAVFDGRTGEAFDSFQRFFDAGKSFSLFLRLIMEHLRDIYLVRQGLNPPRDTFTDDEKAALKARAASLTRKSVVALMDETARVEDRIRWEVYPRIILEILIIKMIELACGEVAEEQPRPAPAPRAPNAAEPEPEPEPAPAPPPAVDPDAPPIVRLNSVWPHALAEIKRANMPKYFFFADGTPESLEGNVLTISYSQEHQFKKEQAQDKDNAALLCKTVEKHYGSPLTIKFKLTRTNGTEEPEPEPAAPPEPAKPGARPMGLFDDVRNIFPESVEIE